MLRIKKRYLLAALLLVACLILNHTFLVRLKTFSFEALSIPIKVVNKIKKSFKPKSLYIKENFYIRENQAKLAFELSGMAEIAKENDRLRELLNFKKRTSHNMISAEVIGRMPSAWRKAVLIDKGTKHGIKKGMAVCTAKGLVGRVSESAPFTSKVTLLSDPNSRIGVVLEETRQAGVLIGAIDDRCRVIYLDMNSPIKEGEKILTSGFGDLFPEGMIVGRVEGIETDRARLYRYALIKLEENLNALEEVLCIE